MTEPYSNPQKFLPVATTPLTDGPIEPLVWCVGAHGGAGTTYLATCIAPFGDADHTFPGANHNPNVLVCARFTAYGIDAAHDALLQARDHNAGAINLLGLALIADSPTKPPKQTRLLLERIKNLKYPIWEIPWIEDFRSLLPKELATYNPLTPPTTTKKHRKQDLTQSPHPHIIATAHDIITAALNHH